MLGSNDVSNDAKSNGHANVTDLTRDKEHRYRYMAPLNGTQGAFTRHSIILSTALLNFGTRANNIGQGSLDFCRVKAKFSARVPKNLGGTRPLREVALARLKRGPRAETRGILVPRVFALMTDQESEGSGLENELRGTKILNFSEEETIRFALENCKTSRQV